MALKFSDHHHESPFDLVLTTGRHGPYFNASTMDQFHAALKSGSDDMKEYLLSMPVWYGPSIIYRITTDRCIMHSSAVRPSTGIGLVCLFLVGEKRHSKQFDKLSKLGELIF